MLGPLSPALSRISPSASDPCSRTCVVTLWCNRLHLTETVHCWRTPRCLWSTDVDIAMLMTPRLLHQWVFMTVYELRRNFVTLANINCCVSSRARGCVGSYQLSVFGFQIVAVFGRIRIVHLAHYSVRFEFESNIRYSPIKYSRHYNRYRNCIQRSCGNARCTDYLSRGVYECSSPIHVRSCI